MTDAPRSTLVRLANTDDTIASGDDDIRGRRVLDKTGQDLGKIDALLVDQDAQKVRFIEVATGGFLGIGKEKSLIPVDAITHIGDDIVQLDQSSETVAGAPSYDPEVVENTNGEYLAGAYGYYGMMPYWGLGYRSPMYP